MSFDVTKHVLHAGDGEELLQGPPATGKVRIVVDPEYRNAGIGRGLLHKIAELAKDKGIYKLMFEVVADMEEAARRTALVQGFFPIAVLRDHVQDLEGKPHDLPHRLGRRKLLVWRSFRLHFRHSSETTRARS